MPVGRPHLIALAAAIVFPCTFLGTYLWAVYLDHADSVWPYISDTGTTPPESCVFGQLLNLGSVMLAGTFYIRYKQVAAFYQGHRRQVLLKRVNVVSLWLGSLGALGVSLVANFQETQVVSVHFFGASLTFGLGTVYLWTQVFLTSFIRPPGWPRTISTLRTVLALLDTVALGLTVISSYLANRTHGPGVELHWTGREGREFHLLSTGSEWVMSTAFSLFILLFIPDFRHLVLEAHSRPRPSLQDASMVEMSFS